MNYFPTNLVALGILFFPLALASPAQQPIGFQYFYDDLNQLSKVVDSTGVVLTYRYDLVGNILQISRSTVAPGALTIFNATPATVPTGGTLTIQGQGFSTTLTANVVTLNGITLTVVSASATMLVVSVPGNATSGTLSISVNGTTVAAPAPVTVLPIPILLSVSPKAALAGAPFTLTVTGTNLTSATFSFYPPLTVFTATVNSAGTSATMTVTPVSTANGYFTLIGTNAAGPSNAAPKLGFLPTITAFNTISIPGSDPNGDPDQDSVTSRSPPPPSSTHFPSTKPRPFP